MKRHYKIHTIEELSSAASSSISYSECLRKLNLRPVGGNFKNLQKNLNKFQINCTHFKGQAHNKGKEIKKFDNLTTNKAIKERLYAERGYKCQDCGISEWRDAPITLELDHIDGNNQNNSRENLRLLCPNCHSQTPTFRNRRRKPIITN